MTTPFSSLPIVDLDALQDDSPLSSSEQQRLSKQLYDVFATTGFAYLINAPLSFTHEEVFRLAKQFFGLPREEKMTLAKKTFESRNKNTYRGYFPAQPLAASDNLKEGFEIGQTGVSPVVFQSSRFYLSEPNVWPHGSEVTSFRPRMERLYGELQSLASKLLGLLAISLGKEADFFAPYLEDSLSTLRLLYYPPATKVSNGSMTALDSDILTSPEEITVKLSCTPHTDSGILTLLHQDSTGGLEVLNASKQWVPAPYLSGSIVVNIGDLMAQVSGGVFCATMHRVRAPPEGRTKDGEISDTEDAKGIVYGEHVRSKMATWVEFQDLGDEEGD
ncbi:Clavaminate synthase-like protein [Xylariaceae sp. FL1019]|nr:Clavaminate synthase-like protein [Xylariaceae sp. FL1019]